MSKKLNYTAHLGYKRPLGNGSISPLYPNVLYNWRKLRTFWTNGLKKSSLIVKVPSKKVKIPKLCECQTRGLWNTSGGHELKISPNTISQNDETKWKVCLSRLNQQKIVSGMCHVTSNICHVIRVTCQVTHDLDLTRWVLGVELYWGRYWRPSGDAWFPAGPEN